MKKHEDTLANFLREVSNWNWEEFALAEHDEQYTSNQAVIFALVRSCAMEKMDAIKLATNRLDGRLKTPINIEYPKIFYLYPNATLPAPGPVTYLPTPPATAGPGLADDKPQAPELEVLTGEIISVTPPPDELEPDLPSMGFRQTMATMSDLPRNLPQAIIDLALQTEQALRRQASRPPQSEIPRVKSVVSAHLLVMASKRNMDAIGEVFDAIDGKLVETLQILGEDIYITDYSALAPPDALPNKDGIMQVEALTAQNLWAEKLGRDRQ